MSEPPQARRWQSRQVFKAKEGKMSAPPTSFTISSWDNGSFAQVLFTVNGSVQTTLIDSTTNLYNLAWTNVNGESRSMSLTWAPNSNDDGGVFSYGNPVMIYDSSDSSGTAEMSVNVTITIANGSCTGNLSLAGTQPSGIEIKLPRWDTTPGIFVAQADPYPVPGADGS
jgi:hypothetical protein